METKWRTHSEDAQIMLQLIHVVTELLANVLQPYLIFVLPQEHPLERGNEASMQVCFTNVFSRHIQLQDLHVCIAVLQSGLFSLEVKARPRLLVIMARGEAKVLNFFNFKAKAIRQGFFKANAMPGLSKVCHKARRGYFAIVPRDSFESRHRGRPRTIRLVYIGRRIAIFSWWG